MINDYCSDVNVKGFRIVMGKVTPPLLQIIQIIHQTILGIAWSPVDRSSTSFSSQLSLSCRLLSAANETPGRELYTLIGRTKDSRSTEAPQVCFAQSRVRHRVAM